MWKACRAADGVICKREVNGAPATIGRTRSTAVAPEPICAAVEYDACGCDESGANNTATPRMLSVASGVFLRRHLEREASGINDLWQIGYAVTVYAACGERRPRKIQVIRGFGEEGKAALVHERGIAVSAMHC